MRKKNVLSAVGKSFSDLKLVTWFVVKLQVLAFCVLFKNYKIFTSVKFIQNYSYWYFQFMLGIEVFSSSLLSFLVFDRTKREIEAGGGREED